MLRDPDLSIAGIARECGWTNDDDEPLKAKVQRSLVRLQARKPKVVEKERHSASDDSGNGARAEHWASARYSHRSEGARGGRYGEC
jgi:hypothetical protein